jgi:malate synthase
MADFEDANSPTWRNVLEGQVNLVDAVEGTLAFDAPDGRAYRLNDETATLLVRPRGWHLPERHVEIGGQPVSASLFDFGLYVFHNAERSLERGAGPYLYLPKLESHLEARLWASAFRIAEDELGLDHGAIKATVLIETILAAFEMDEILWELRDHSPALNAGRWDYIFSVIKKFRERDGFLLPDRAQVTMAVPFMRAYAQLLVKTTHARGAFAIGGMAAFIPSRRDAELNERALARVREDKEREAGDGFDGTWVAHPDLVPTALEEFDKVHDGRTNQVERQRDDVSVGAAELLDFEIPGGEITDEGVHMNVDVGLRYLDAWLGGVGAAAINNLMEDVATAEISRAQLWQWVHQGAVSADRVRELAAAESGELRDPRAAEIFERVALSDHFEEFLTLPAYDYLED